MKLVLCANTRQLEGYKHHDVLDLPGIDYVCELFDIGKYVEPESCEEIQFTHALEHFPRADTQNVLELIRALLIPRGRLYLEVPNFAWHAKLVMEGKDKEAVYYAFGGQLDEWDFHKTGFTPRILEDQLELAGFSHEEILNDSTMCVWATKL